MISTEQIISNQVQWRCLLFDFFWNPQKKLTPSEHISLMALFSCVLTKMWRISISCSTFYYWHFLLLWTFFGPEKHTFWTRQKHVTGRSECLTCCYSNGPCACQICCVFQPANMHACACVHMVENNKKRLKIIKKVLFSSYAQEAHVSLT